MKWIFPRLRTSDVSTWEKLVVNADAGEGYTLHKEDIQAIVGQWRTFSSQDTEGLNASRALVRDASLVGDWPTANLTKAAWFLSLFEAREESQRDGQDSESEDSPWPDKEERQTSFGGIVRDTSTSSECE